MGVTGLVGLAIGEPMPNNVVRLALGAGTLAVAGFELMAARRALQLGTVLDNECDHYDRLAHGQIDRPPTPPPNV
jgi:hypothetical protein